jgi:DNA-binding NtrC family response regulator
MVLLDLCFYTGNVTDESNRQPGMPEGRSQDDNPSSYFGLSILQAIREEFPELPVVILSANPRDEVSRDISRRGALGFIARGDPDARKTLGDYLWRHGLIPDAGGVIVGQSISLMTALRSARRAAASPRNVLLRGDRGTGKEALAAYVHRCTPLGEDRPYVVVHASGLTPQLYASELFGHTKGSFTGAQSARAGAVELADGGDLFLDEIGNMLPDVQAGVLRAVESKEVSRVGSNSSIKVDVRFIAVTNEDIEGRALLGEFRSDLLDRLRPGGTIHLPALRERREDIPLLIKKFLSDEIHANPKALTRDVSREAVELLLAQPWPGNIRQLESCVRGAAQKNPDVEYLYPLHFELSSAAPSGAKITDRVTQPAIVLSESGTSEAIGELSLGELLRRLESFSFEGIKYDEVHGALPRVEKAYARFVARLVEAVLLLTVRRTPEKPDGIVQIHPAMKALTGDKTLKGSRAADLVKKLLSISVDSVKDLLDSGLLREAQSKAVSLRPKSPKKVTPSKSEVGK